MHVFKNKMRFRTIPEKGETVTHQDEDKGRIIMKNIIATMILFMGTSVFASSVIPGNGNHEKIEHLSNVQFTSTELVKILKNSDFYALSLMLNTGVPEIYRVLIETVKIKHVIAVENDLKELIKQQKETNLLLKEIKNRGIKVN